MSNRKKKVKNCFPYVLLKKDMNVSNGHRLNMSKVHLKSHWSVPVTKY